MKPTEGTHFSPNTRVTDYQNWDDTATLNKFQLKLSFKDLSDSKIAILQSEDSTKTLIDQPTPFWMIMAHEMIHALQFMNDDVEYYFVITHLVMLLYGNILLYITMEDFGTIFREKC